MKTLHAQTNENSRIYFFIYFGKKVVLLLVYEIKEIGLSQQRE
jgi:hypothetical protein